MLTASTLSRVSQSSASYSENVDLEIVDIIIGRARDATTFPEVYKAYVEVLEDNGVSPAKDAAYYQFLLKLGIVRAPTWGERWTIWRRTHAAHGLSARQPLSPQVPNTSGLADMKKRVPFLASASSDLDEAYAKSTDNGEEEASVVSFLAGLQRPSPRKAMGLVGYTPSVSFDSTHDAPYRNSTPVYDRNGTPRPPPYTESEVSDVSGSRVSYGVTRNVEEDDERLIDAFSTPRGVPPPLEDLTLDDPLEDAAETNEYDDDTTGSIDPMLAWEMERRADDFYRTGLMGRCWDVWAQSADWIRNTTTQIDNVRGQLLLRHSLAQWRRSFERLLEMPNTADAHRRIHLQFAAMSRWVEALKDRDLVRREQHWVHEQGRRDVGSAWVRWREALGTRRTERFLKDISTRESEWRAEKDEELLRRSLQAWHDRTRDRVGARTADEHFESKLVRDSFEWWRDQAERSGSLRQRSEQWEESHRVRLLGKAFGDWRQSARLGQTEMGLAHMAERRALYRAWQVWRQKIRQCKIADRFSALACTQRAFSTWRNTASRHRANERKAETLRKRQDLHLLAGALKMWKTAERGELLLRVRTDRLVREVLGSWRGRFEDNVDRLDLASTSHARHLDRIEKESFAVWRSRAQLLRANEEVADETRKIAIIKTSLKTWRQSSYKIEASRAAADKARAFFLQREVLKAWKIAVAEAKRDRWIERRRIQELKIVFLRWQEETVKSIQRKRALQSFMQKRDQALQRQAIGVWTDRIIEIKARELDVKENHDLSLLSDAFGTWRDRYRQIHEAEDLARSFIEVSASQSLKRVFRYWKAEALKSRDRRQKLDETLRDRDEALVVHCFETWLENFRERRLSVIEQEVRLRQEDALMFKVWDQWIGRARVLPAVQFDNSRVKQLAWARWRKAFELARQAKAVGKARERELLLAIFASWREAAALKVASKPKRTRGRIRAHTPEQELRSSTSSTSAQGPSKPRRSIGSPILGGRAPLNPTSQEPTYSRLRSELIRPRTVSRGSPVLLQEPAAEGQSTSSLVKALRGAMSDR